MIVRSFIPAAALALALGGPAAAFTSIPPADTALPLILAQAEDAEARLRATEERVEQAEEALRQAEEELAEATGSGGDVEAAQEDADAARVELEAAVVELRIAEEAFQAAQQAQPEPPPEAEELAEPEPEPEVEELAEPEAQPAEPELAEPEPEPEAEELAEPEAQPAEPELAEPEPEPETEELAGPEPEPEAEQVAEPERPAETAPEQPPAATEEVQRERREPGEGRADRPSLRERMEERRQAQPEQPEAEEPAAQAAPEEPPAETQDAQPDPQEAPAETLQVQPEPQEPPAETQEAQPERPEGRERREGGPSLRQRMEEREQAQPEQPEQPDEPAAEAASDAAPADAPQAVTETEPAVDETPEERQERRGRRDRRSLQERAEERERMERDRPQAERAERDRREAAAEEAPGLASELPEDAEVLRREGDRVIIRRGNQEIVRKDESERLRRFSRQTRTERLQNGWTRTVSVRRSGIEVVTIWDEYGDIVERVRRYPDGREVVLIDTRELRRERRDRGPRIHLDVQLPPLVVTIPREQYIVEQRRASREDIYAALTAPPVEEPPRVFTLQEVREIERVRDMVPRIDLDTITFEFNSAAIPTDQIDALDVIGQTIEAVLDDNPEEMYLIEGHTDAVGSELYNLALSDGRAESVAFALSDYFDIPPENLVTQGYGEQFLKVPTEEPERENRRVTIRRITPLVSAER